MSVNIRPESPGDYDAITVILLEAFADHPYSHQTEHLIVNELRRSKALTISLVAEADGQIVGVPVQGNRHSRLACDVAHYGERRKLGGANQRLPRIARRRSEATQRQGRLGQGRCQQYIVVLARVCYITRQALQHHHRHEVVG